MIRGITSADIDCRSGQCKHRSFANDHAVVAIACESASERGGRACEDIEARRVESTMLRSDKDHAVFERF